MAVDTKAIFMKNIKKKKEKPKTVKGVNTSLKAGLETVLKGKCPDCGKNVKNCKC